MRRPSPHLLMLLSLAMNACSQDSSETTEAPQSTSGSSGGSTAVSSSLTSSESSTTMVTGGAVTLTSASEGVASDGSEGTALTTEASTSEVSTGPQQGCADIHDAPDSEYDAVKMATLSCPSEVEVFEGVLKGSEDSDWFAYDAVQGPDACSSSRATVSADADSDLRVCIFPRCDFLNDTETYYNCQGLDDESSPGGRPGCCYVNQVSVIIECLDAPAEAEVLVRVDSALPGSCVNYNLSYSYHDM